MENNKSMTYQLNPLINVQKEFNVIETRLFYLGLKAINPHLTENDIYFDKEFPDTRISPSELKEIFGNGKYLPEIKKACKRIVGTIIEINYEDGFDLYTVFRHLRYKENVGLRIQFNEDMRPFLLDIYKGYKKYGFTKIEMQQIFILGSAYAMRLLETLLQYSGTKKNGIITRTIALDELKNRLAVPAGTYKQMCNFRHIVLDLPIKEIERKTRYTINYEPIKKGRSIVAFKFICNCNNVIADDEYTATIDMETLEEVQDHPATPAIEEHEDQTQQETLIKMVSYGFSLSIINKLTEICGSETELAKRLEFAEKRAKSDQEKGKEIKSISGYIRKAIEENWLQAKKDEEKAQKRELEAVKTNEEWEIWAKQNFGNEPASNKPEKLFDKEINSFLISVIKNDIKSRNLSSTSRRLLEENGLTVSRFIELYM